MTVKHFVFCWEIGADLGHITQVATIAQALQERGYRVSAIIKDVTHAVRYLKPLGIHWYQAPQSSGFRSTKPPLNHADILRGKGYGNSDQLAGLLLAWAGLLKLLKAIAEAAPTAALAARSAGLPYICLDSGFFSPPLSSPMPALRSWASIAVGELERRETQILQVINSALGQLGFRSLTQFSELFDLNTYWLTWPELNHFGKHSPGRHLGPIYGESGGLVMDWPEGAGARVFAYLKHSHPKSFSMLEWCLRRGYRVMAYLPSWPDSLIQKLKALGAISISPEPVDLQRVLASCDLVVCHGGIGTVSRSLRAGKPLLLLPSHVEQMRTARAAEALRLAVLPVTCAQFGTLEVNVQSLKQACQNAEGYAPRLGTAEASLAKLLTVLDAQVGTLGRRLAASTARTPITSVSEAGG